MDKNRVILIIFTFLFIAIPSFSAPTDPYALSSQDKKVMVVGKKVVVVEIESVINPIIAEFIQNCIDKSSDDGAECLIIMLDTPGGLDLSMRSIIKAIEGSKVPIVVYVAPSGARAASAGALITLASHIAAMAPGTNIGAAHPVSMGGQKMDEEMVKKVENDAAAYIRSLANKHNRNADWAEKAVRESVSITAREAKELKVIEIIASDLTELLNSIHEMKVAIGGKERELNTKEAAVVTIEMGLRHRILNTISDPNIAYILMMIGMWGLFFELSNPGVIFPGVIGGISLILAFVAFQTLPINYAGILLIILGMIFFIAEIKVTSFGLLTIGGIISLLLGSLMLFESPLPYLRVSWNVLILSVLLTAGFFIFAISLSLRAYLTKPFTGAEGLVGEKGIAKTRIDPEGKVFIHGEFWNATSEEVVEAGGKVKVVGVENLLLRVTKL